MRSPLCNSQNQAPRKKGQASRSSISGSSVSGAAVKALMLKHWRTNNYMRIYIFYIITHYWQTHACGLGRRLCTISPCSCVLPRHSMLPNALPLACMCHQRNVN